MTYFVCYVLGMAFQRNPNHVYWNDNIHYVTDSLFGLMDRLIDPFIYSFIHSFIRIDFFNSRESIIIDDVMVFSNASVNKWNGYGYIIGESFYSWERLIVIHSFIVIPIPRYGFFRILGYYQQSDSEKGHNHTYWGRTNLKYSEERHSTTPRWA